jgi:hypothetical protein
VLLEHLVGEIGTCLEGETLRLAEGVVTVEEDVLDLKCEGAASQWACAVATAAARAMA